MAIKKIKPVSPGRRFASYLKSDRSGASRPGKKLRRILSKNSGRDSSGSISVRHRGGRQKRYYRLIDYKRDKFDITAKVASIEYDPNRGSDIALLHYTDGEKRYILAPKNLRLGQVVVSGDKAPLEIGNATRLARIPAGTLIHNIELQPGKGGQMVRGAGGSAVIQSKEGGLAVVKLPSGELRKFPTESLATIGEVGRAELKILKLGKAGRKRLMGWRPAVRGVAQHPASHPHGGGEGRSPIGMPSPKSPWGKKTMGKRTRKRVKYSDKLIIKRRK